jgi:hypothetical protein
MMHTNDTDPNETAALAATGEAAESAATASAETGELAGFRIRLGSGLRFIRHLLEMVVAMMLGISASSGPSRS